ncbi:ferritin family protein [Haloimpatiens lingqiaonensis]|uniref:ferritin family protein n=1 Tax=Haloimpatiens lingqiaonensis TaxID=1380675 RepID=UPI0010FCF0E0|nr:ferritin-like domain-containing protein [Haloimpatiens lingqiaonensis]
MYVNPCYGGMMYDMSLLNTSLELIKQAVQDEKEDAEFYEYLIKKAPTKEEKEIIESIRNDELKHNKMFREIYIGITGMNIPASEDTKFKKPKSYIEGIKKALFGELSAVEKYREIKIGLPSRCSRDMLFEIITDEIKHSIKYNYILYLNCCEKKRSSTEDSHSEENFTRYADFPMYQRIPEDFMLLKNISTI